MQLYFLTSVGSSVDANGNLQFTNTAGTVLAKFVNGIIATKGFTSAYSNSNSPSTTAGSVSVGLGISITPQISARVLVLASGQLTGSHATDLATANVYRNTTGVPAQGTSTGSDTPITGAFDPIITDINSEYTFSFNKTDTTVVVGTTYYYYLSYGRVSGSGNIIMNNTYGIAAAEL